MRQSRSVFLFLDHLEGLERGASKNGEGVFAKRVTPQGSMPRRTGEGMRPLRRKGCLNEVPGGHFIHPGLFRRKASPSGGAKKKHLLRQVLFSMKRTFRCMKNEAGLRPMKRAFGTWRELCALRFMFAKQTHHTSAARASYRVAMLH